MTRELQVFLGTFLNYKVMNTIYNKERKRRGGKKKPETYQNFDNNTINIVKKILMEKKNHQQ
jgi:hypothetical protein